MPTATPPRLDLIVDALRAQADVRKRAGVLLAEALAEARAAGADVRSRALRVVDELADGEALAGYADALAAGDLTVVAPETAAAEVDSADVIAELRATITGDPVEAVDPESEAYDFDIIGTGDDDDTASLADVDAALAAIDAEAAAEATP